MPLIHSTKIFYGRNILRDGVLKLRTCPVFKEDLLYFYYAKPAYKKPDSKSTTDTADLPVVFIFEPNVTPHKIFPFDTGAFNAKMFESIIDDKYDIHKFAMPADISKLGKYINAVFKNNKSYFLGEHNLSSKIKNTGNDYLEVFLQLVLKTGQSKFDERNHTVEIQTKNELLLKGNLIAIIASNKHLDENKGELTKIAKSLNADILPYDAIGGLKEDQYAAEIYKLVKVFYKKRKSF